MKASLTSKHGNTICFLGFLPMKNVTITLDDAVASRADVEAANRGKSLSGFVSELIKREIGWKEMTDIEAMEKFLSGPGIPATADSHRLPNRQELYDERIDELVRRYERSNLRDRHAVSGQERES
jgi:hypothetical protein